MGTHHTVSNIDNLTHGKVIHALKRRIRVISKVLLKDAERAYILEILLRKRPGIEHVRTVADIGSIVIHFDPQTLSKADLLKFLDILLGNLGQRKPTAINHKP
ncbi:MAG: hypothetical protein Q8N96_16290 [Methylovulum sp.]|nr:hypothetical protein [Methylovulum sp.]